jgi:two-component system chemotaxis response regulator CheY
MKILIAEDDDVSRQLLCGMLESEASWQVTAVENGARAWAQLSGGGTFDLVISDLMMPEMDGLDLIGRIRASSRLATLPVILCTALNDRATVTQAASLEVAHYIVKPYRRATVLAKIREIAAQRQDQDVLEPEESACARLEIEPTLWYAMMSQLTEGTNRWIAEAARTLRPDEVRSLSLRANALKGACVNLGATGLATQFNRAETTLAGCQQTNVFSTQGNLLDPMVFGDLTSVAGDVHQELQRLERALERRGAAVAPAG